MRGFCRVLLVSGRVSCPPGPILESAFLCFCFCRQKPPCTHRRSRPQDRHLRSKTIPGAPEGPILGPRTKDLASMGPRNLRSRGTRPPKRKPSLGRTYGRISDFSFGGRTDNGHEMVSALVSGADFRCVLHQFSSLTWLKGSWGQVWPENGPKPKLKARLQFLNISPTQF